MKNNKFNINDHVAVLNDTLTGIVIDFDNDVYQIEDKDGFLYYYNENELVINDKAFHNYINRVPIKDRLINSPKKNVKKIKKETFIEVDLHIHHLVTSNKYLSNTEILLKQISFAKSKLNYAIKNNIQKIIFIHGKGQGVLKNELITLLNKYPVEINDASYKKYGNGATEVRIFKTKL